ncbi:MAG: PAS domain S-box protein [Candidatus Aminicenantes bacterium]|nr:PAS domain S-box protein [Candidatus Aminicenantes bacterium]
MKKDKNKDKTREQLIEELTTLQRRFAELEASEEKYRNLFEKVNDMILFLNFKGDIVEANKKVEEVSGYSRDVLPINVLKFLGPGQALKFARRLKNLKIKKKLPPAEYTITNKEGKKIAVEITSTLLEFKGKPKGLMVVGRDISERKKAEKRIKNSLKEKEVLLKEIHHRVKNNMQIISSLLSLQEMTLKDRTVQKMFRESQIRIRSMSLIHDKLYRSKDLTRINIGEYIDDLVIDLFRAYDIKPTSVTLENQVEKIYFDLDTAIPCCLIINELIANSLKHAFPGGKGHITVSLSENRSDKYTLIIRDNGIGYPENYDYQDAQTLGFQLVPMFVKKLHGIMKAGSPGGAETKITFEIKT